MANTKAYIQSLQNKDGADVYPVTVADAVYVQKSDGSTITQTKLSKKITEIESTQSGFSSTLSEMEKNFTDGCNTIVSALTGLGVTPEATTPAGIAAAIKKLYEDRYNSGIKKGHDDVIADPASYGLISQAKYDAYGEERYEAGVADGAKNALATLSFDSFSASFSYDNVSDEGTKARVVGKGNASVYAKNGTVYLSINGSGTATSWQWSDPNWISEHSTSGSGSGSNSKNLSA